MNSFEESPTNSIDQATIDRLVAGDLGELERRQILLKLEIDPDGWRRCALAFLEDQAWRMALSSMAGEVSKPNPVPTATPIARPRLSLRFAVAASILALAFLAGFAARGVGRHASQINISKEVTPVGPSASPVVETNQIREVGWIDLDDGTNGELPPRRVPIVSGPGLDEKWLRDQPSSIPDYVRARWERQGYQIQERRNLVSVLLEDGRRVSIPVDEVALDYVGQTPL